MSTKFLNGYTLQEMESKTVSDSLIDQLMGVAESSFGYSMPREEVESVARKSSKLLVVRDSGVPVAFGSYKMIDPSFAYLSGSCVHSDHKNEKIYTGLMDKRISMLRGKIDYVSTRTQSPIVYSVFSKSVDEMYSDEGNVTEEVFNMAKKVDDRVDRDMIVRGCYGRRLSITDSLKADSKVEKMFEKLDMDKGDAFVLLGRIGV